MRFSSRMGQPGVGVEVHRITMREEETGPAAMCRAANRGSCMKKLVRRWPGCRAAAIAGRTATRLSLLYGGLVLACAGAVAQPQSGAGPATSALAASAAPLDLPLKNEAEYTDRLNAELQAAHVQRERHRERARWISAATVSGLVIGFAALAGWALRSRQSRTVRLSRLVLWTPCLLLASAWFFPWSLYAAAAWVPALALVWWKRALPWGELGVASALYLSALVFTGLVFRTLAGMDGG